MDIRSRNLLHVVLTVAVLTGAAAHGATITVTTTHDTIATTDGVSLREAITSINNGADVNSDVTAGRSGSYGSADTINFNIAGGGVQTITVAGTQLPAIVKPLTIDGYTQPGSAANSAASGNSTAVLDLRLDGTGLAQPGNGLILGVGSSGSTVRGLIITNFANTGITIEASSNNLISGNFIGTTGLAVAGNGFTAFTPGILVEATAAAAVASNNTIGGTTPQARNIIAGNLGGIKVQAYNGGVANGTIIQGNFIGTNKNGTAVLVPSSGNAAGIYIQGVNSTQIGGTTGTTPGGACTGACNLISGNYGGITILGDGITNGTTQNTVIQGNFIGTNAAGTTGFGNTTNSNITLTQACGATLIGGTSPNARNIISGSASGSVGYNGIDIQNHNSPAVMTIQGNYIGTTSSGGAGSGPSPVGIGNGGYGVHVYNTSGTVIGGSSPAAGNVISGNGLAAASGYAGIMLEGGDTSTVQNNLVGVASDGSTPLGNGGPGIATMGSGFGNSSNNIIGASSSGAAGGNIVAYNNQASGVFSPAGVKLQDFGGINNKILSNIIYSNEGVSGTGIGIDLGGDGVTANDHCDSDNGANKLQNTPVLTSVQTTGAQTTFTGTIDATLSSSYVIEFFADSAVANSEGRVYLGFANVGTNNLCNGSFTATLPVGVTLPANITATATDPSGNTSEFAVPVAATLKPTYFGDMNGDGKADILWHHALTGANYTYRMSGLSILSQDYINAVPDTNWNIVGIGDFDGDGKADILWRNSATGQNYIYLMNGATIGGNGVINTVADTNWQVVGTGDFDGDGRADILWRHMISGANYIYFMNGLTILNQLQINTVADQAWQVAGVGDFDGDGKADILWRNSSTGQNYVYLMNGATIGGNGVINTIADQNWKVAGVGDFNLDRKADILWHNIATGATYIYFMSGLTISQQDFVNTTPTVWVIVAVEDFNGDGVRDILWRNTSTGQNYIYIMSGSAIGPNGVINIVSDQNWKVIGK